MSDTDRITAKLCFGELAAGALEHQLLTCHGVHLAARASTHCPAVISLLDEMCPFERKTCDEPRRIFPRRHCGSGTYWRCVVVFGHSIGHRRIGDERPALLHRRRWGMGQGQHAVKMRFRRLSALPRGIRDGAWRLRTEPGLSRRMAASAAIFPTRVYAASLEKRSPRHPHLMIWLRDFLPFISPFCAE